MGILSLLFIYFNFSIFTIFSCLSSTFLKSFKESIEIISEFLNNEKNIKLLLPILEEVTNIIGSIIFIIFNIIFNFKNINNDSYDSDTDSEESDSEMFYVENVNEQTEGYDSDASMGEDELPVDNASDSETQNIEELTPDNLPVSHPHARSIPSEDDLDELSDFQLNEVRPALRELEAELHSIYDNGPIQVRVSAMTDQTISISEEELSTIRTGGRVVVGLSVDSSTVPYTIASDYSHRVRAYSHGIDREYGHCYINEGGFRYDLDLDLIEDDLTSGQGEENQDQ